MFDKLFSSALFRSAGIFTLANLMNAAIPFLLIPVLTRYLTPEEFGIVSMFKVFVGLVFSIVGLGINGAITRMYYESETVDFPKYIGNAVILVSISTAIITMIFAGFGDSIREASAIPGDWIWLILFTAYGKVMFQILLVVWQVEFKPLSYGVFQVTQTMLNFGFSLVFVIALSMNWQGPIIAECGAFFLFGLISIIILLRKGSLDFNIKKDYMAHALKFGLPLIPHVLGLYIITASDRLFINNMVGVAEAGIYTVGYQIGMILMILQDSFNKAWVPWLFERLKQNEYQIKVKIVKITYIYFVVILLVAAGLAWIAPWLLSFFVGEQFRSAEVFVRWLAFGYAFNGMYKMVTNYIFFAEKTVYLAYVTSFTAIINIILNYVFISLNGAEGASQATMVAYFISFVLTWIISYKAFKMPWFSKKKLA